jgi:cytochrome c peroxidase
LRLVSILLLAGCPADTPEDEPGLTKEELGRVLFFDGALSSPPGQACAACHAPESGWVDPRGTPTSEGAVAGRFGPRNAPSIAYAAFTPERIFDPSLGDDGACIGGVLWDGRAGTLLEQAEGPFLAHVEMNDPTRESVVEAVEAADYAADFRAVYGEDVFADVDSAFVDIADAIQAFEQTDEVSPFSSKYDAFLAGDATLTDAEQSGMAVARDNRCLVCHSDAESPPLFTDHRFANLGTPANPDNRFYEMPASLNPDGPAFVDLGLGPIVGDEARNGYMKTPTLRNVAVTAPYMHNGVFTSLEQVVSFYSSRDTDPSVQPAEVPETMTDSIGNLNIPVGDQADLIAFLRTLTDGWSE